jgi:hypothetical protein
MIPFNKSGEYLCEITTGENRVHSKQRGREREKESSRLTEGEMEHWAEMEMARVENGR